uniref:47-kDa merozoite protein n=1 Tax=Babesia gibsoni TaxID=33632 RepID=D2KY65_BABGI|nr:47-kDa merozoite protein [Babesia gibsoni]
MKVINTFLLFPLAFSLVRANGEDQETEATESNPKPVHPQLATFQQQLEFVARFDEAFNTAEEEYKKKLVHLLPLYKVNPFKDVWIHFKEGVKNVAELYAVLLRVPQSTATPAADEERKPSASLQNLLDIALNATGDALHIADKAVKTVIGIEIKDGVLNATLENAELLSEVLPEFFEKLLEFKKVVEDAYAPESQVDGGKLFTRLGHSPVEPYLKNHGFKDGDFKREASLKDLRKKLIELVDTGKHFQEVLGVLAADALMRTPDGPMRKQAWLFLLSSTMHNEAMKERLKDAVNKVTGKGDTFVEELKKLGPQIKLPKEKTPKGYLFPGEYVNCDVHHFWTVLTGVFGTILDDISKAAPTAKTGGGVVPQELADLVKVQATLGKLAEHVDEVNIQKAAATTQAAEAAAAQEATAAVQATPGLRKEGQGEDGAQFTGVGMAMFCVSVAVAVF